MEVKAIAVDAAGDPRRDRSDNSDSAEDVPRPENISGNEYTYLVPNWKPPQEVLSGIASIQAIPTAVIKSAEAAPVSKPSIGKLIDRAKLSKVSGPKPVESMHLNKSVDKMLKELALEEDLTVQKVAKLSKHKTGVMKPTKLKKPLAEDSEESYFARQSKSLMPVTAAVSSVWDDLQQAEQALKTQFEENMKKSKINAQTDIK
jgi:hypothetical protein